MKIVAQSYINVDDECREFETGPPRRNFVSAPLYFRKLASAWMFNEANFELTLHMSKSFSSSVIAFACGRIKPVQTIDAACVVELIGVKDAFRGQGLAIRMHEFIMKTTALPLVAAHVQTSEGRDLWLRMLRQTKQTAMFAMNSDRISRIREPTDVPDDMYNSDATFMINKTYSGYRLPDSARNKGGRRKQILVEA